MCSDVPNLAAAFGYTNASWTNFICSYVSRLLNYLEKHGYRQCTPRNKDPNIEPLSPVNFTSGYLIPGFTLIAMRQRVMDKLRKQGSRKPWQITRTMSWTS